MRRYDLAMFDFDGTLADSFGWLMGVMGEVADQYGFKRLDASELHALRGLDGRDFLRYIGLPLWKVPLVARHVRKLQARDAATIRTFPGVPTMLRDLVGRGVRIALVTSNCEANVRAVLGADTSRLVTFFACDASLFGKAPKIRKVLGITGVPAAKAILVGDETRDIEAARRAGVACGVVSWGYADVAALVERGPDEVFGDVGEIADRLAPPNVEPC